KLLQYFFDAINKNIKFIQGIIIMRRSSYSPGHSFFIKIKNSEFPVTRYYIDLSFQKLIYKSHRIGVPDCKCDQTSQFGSSVQNPYPISINFLSFFPESSREEFYLLFYPVFANIPTIFKGEFCSYHGGVGKFPILVPHSMGLLFIQVFFNPCSTTHIDEHRL